MTVRLTLLLALLLLAGCRSGSKSALGKLSEHKPRPEANVPPRKKIADAGQSSPSDDTPRAGYERTSEINLTEFVPQNATSGEALELTGATIVAQVNAVPIFASDVLEPYAAQLEKASAQLTPEQMNRLRAQVIQQNLPKHIEKAVLVSALRESLKKEELAKVDEQLDKIWAEHELERLKKEFKVETTLELERLLEQQGTTLANLKQGYTSREMAMYYMGQKTRQSDRLGPKELRAWYDAHREEFKIDAKARWQQIQISFAKHGGRPGALKKLNEVKVALQQGQDFGTLAKRFSDGLHAAEGGYWDWTTQGSLANKDINRALFELDVGKISTPIDTGDAFVLVKVIERQNGGYQEFEDVQNDINKRLTNDARRESADRAINELMETASIWTIFDKSPTVSRSPSPARTSTR